MNFMVILEIFGGLSIFLYGIHILSDGLKKASSSNVKKILAKGTSNPFAGTFVGIGATALIQSSSATTVLTVGFVNAGLMKLSQAIGIIYGANIGTTVTGQIMAFKISDYALLFVIIGAILNIFTKKAYLKNIGAFLMGLGFIFFGMHMMKGGVGPLKHSQEFKDFFVRFSHNPILAVLTGMVLTMVLQSSSATVGIVITLAAEGLIDLHAAIPLIMGDNIGTCITASLASIGTNLTARRTAAAHFGFNIIGTLIVLILLPIYKNIIVLTADSLERQVANAHTIFNVVNALIFLPFTKWYTQLIEFIVKGKTKKSNKKTKYLSNNLFETPAVAIDAVRKEISRSLDYSKTSLDICHNVLLNKKSKSLEIILENEDIVDILQYEVTQYLIEFTSLDLNKHDASLVPNLLHAINDSERIGDHCENLYQIIKRMKNQDVNFAKTEVEQFDKIIIQLLEFMNWLIPVLDDIEYFDIETAKKYEYKINELRDLYRKHYYELIKNEKEDPTYASIYYDLILNFEKVGDHLLNIAEAFWYYE